MSQKSMSKNDPAERAVRDIRRKTRKQYSAEEKIRIVVSGLRGEDSIAELCRRPPSRCKRPSKLSHRYATKRPGSSRAFSQANHVLYAPSTGR